MTRKKNILDRIKKGGAGLEIGPSHSPIAPKKAGFNVEIIDHASKEELLKKYGPDGPMAEADVSKIEDVDYIWKGESYAELTGKRHHYDWVIASHLIEHVPDLISFINDCDAVLKDDGLLCLAIPDRRYCFDYFRPVSSLAKVLDSHEFGLKQHSRGTVVEASLFHATLSQKNVWDKANEGNTEFDFANTLEVAIAASDEALEEQGYIDLHTWCFVPHSFRLMMDDLYHLGLIKMREVHFVESEGCEFFAILSRSGTGPGLSRIEMAKRMDIEIRIPFSGRPPTISKPPSASKKLRRFVRKGLRLFK